MFLLLFGCFFGCFSLCLWGDSDKSNTWAFCFGITLAFSKMCLGLLCVFVGYVLYFYEIQHIRLTSRKYSSTLI